ncbi:MAG: hypothetical protein RMK19_05570 [Bacteroidia bacterium]|nr:hypothetical protein [Bacteroidia bacterium]MDW8015463.1 hypothetical protein [Bacteroidia bacterium]
MRKVRPATLVVIFAFLVMTFLEACAAGRAGSRSSWLRSGSCPATRIDNHVY